MTRPILVPILTAALAGLLGGCMGIGDTSSQAATRQKLIGMSQSQLLACAGVPDRSRVEGTVEYMTYENAMMTADRRAGFDLTTGFGIGTGVGVETGFSTPIGEEAVRSDYCEATFTVASGRVADVTFNTAGGFNRFDQCRTLVQSCIAS